MFKIITAATSLKLEKEAAKYDIKELGSLTISNGHYYIAILGELKVPQETLSKPKEEEPTKPKPKRRTRAKA